MRLLFSTLLLLIVQISFCQTDSANTIVKKIERETSDSGSVKINQDARATELLDRHVEINKDNESKIEGWRIQIYNSSGSESKKEALEIRNKFLSKYPYLEAYTVYQPPFFKIRVGNFRTREEAYHFFKKIVQDFPVSYLVRDKIELPKLKK